MLTRNIRTLVIALLSFSSLFAQTQIAVVDFEALGVSVDESRALTNRLMIELHRTNKFIVLEREMLDKIIDEQKFQLSGCTADQCLIELGQIANVQQIVAGSVSKMGAVFTITSRMISIESGEVVKTGIFDYEGNIGELMKLGMGNIAAQLASDSIPKSETNQADVEEIGRMGKVSAQLTLDLIPKAETDQGDVEEVGSMIKVSGGTFIMGNTERGFFNSFEKPAHNVTVEGFYISKYEVTQESYTKVMENNPSKFEGNNKPAESVSWFDAIEYCNRLSSRKGFNECYSMEENNVVCDWSANGYRLPTEAEWEFAARNGGEEIDIGGADNKNSLGRYAWYKSNSDSNTHPVGTKEPNGLGVYDMSGNVWEWCWDRSGNYDSMSLTNPVGPILGKYRIIRGGSWSNTSSNVRCLYRSNGQPYFNRSNIGFRIIRKL